MQRSIRINDPLNIGEMVVVKVGLRPLRRSDMDKDRPDTLRLNLAANAGTSSSVRRQGSTPKIAKEISNSGDSSEAPAEFGRSQCGTPAEGRPAPPASSSPRLEPAPSMRTSYPEAGGNCLALASGYRAGNFRPPRPFNSILKGDAVILRHQDSQC